MAEPDTLIEADPSTGEAMPDDLTRKLIGWVKEDMPRVRKWRKAAKEDFQFYAGDQWDEDDLNKLRAKNRPAMSFNRIAPLVNAITGSEINNRREVRYFPRELGDALGNELLSSAAEWFRDECNAEDEESDAFEDAVIAGMGWTETRLDFDVDPDGAPKIERIDCMEMGWHCAATKPNLEDARRLWRVRELPVEEAISLTGEKDIAKLHAGWVKDIGDVPDAHDQDRSDRYDGTQSDLVDAYQRKKVVLVEIRWLEKESYWRGPDMMQPDQLREYAEQQVKAIQAQWPEFRAVKQNRDVVRRAFVGKEVIGKPDTPMVPGGLFGWEAITGYRDKVKKQFYGVVRTAKDPQRWSNKFFSQVMHLLNSQSKGGILAEKSAFENQRQAEASWAKVDEITYVKDGALGQNPKIQPKPQAQFPAGFFTLFQESKEAITDVTGLSAEFIGTREVDQAGVLEYQRRQSSLNLLASLFNSLRRYRKRQGRVMLYLIQEHLADGRLIRIVGEDRKQYVPLTRQDVSNVQYDIIVDDSPSSPNEKERTWQILMQMLPMVRDMITPDVAIELMALSPMPASIVEKLKQKAAEKAQESKEPSPDEIKAQAEMQRHEMDMAGKQADLQVKQAAGGMDVQMKGIDLMIKQQEAEMDAARDQEKLRIDLAKLAIAERQNAIAASRAATQRTNSARN